MIEPVKYGNDEFYMCAGMWYRMNADGFDYVSNFIRRHCVREADMEYFNKSVEVIKFKFEHSQKLYIKIVGPNIHFLYRSDYNPRYMYEPWIDLNDAILNQSKDREQMSKEEFDALYNAKWPSNKNSFISNGKTTDYELNFNTWYEVNKTEYDEIIRGLPVSIHKLLWDDQIDYGYKCFITRSKIYISFEYVRKVDDETYILNISKAAPLTYTRPNLISRHIKPTETFNLFNIVNGAKTGKSTFNALKTALDGMLGAPLCRNEKEKVMEDNKLEAVRNIVKDYYEAQLESINKEYENTVKQAKEKDENYKAAKEYVASVNRRIDKETQDEIAFEDIPITLTRDTYIAIETVDKIREERISALKDKCALTKNLLGMCDTFEQRFNILIAQKIIENDTLKEEKKTTKRGK